MQETLKRPREDDPIIELQNLLDASDTFIKEMPEELANLGYTFKTLNIHDFRRDILKLLSNPDIELFKKRLLIAYEQISADINSLEHNNLGNKIQKSLNILNQLQTVRQHLSLYRGIRQTTHYESVKSYFDNFLITEYDIQPSYFLNSFSQPNFHLKTLFSFLSSAWISEQDNLVVRFVLEGMAEKESKELTSPCYSPPENVHFFNEYTMAKTKKVLTLLDNYHINITAQEEENKVFFLDLGETYGEIPEADIIKRLVLLKNTMAKTIEDYKPLSIFAITILDICLQDTEKLMQKINEEKIFIALKEKLETFSELKKSVSEQLKLLETYKEDLDLLENALTTNHEPDTTTYAYLSELFIDMLITKYNITPEEGSEFLSSYERIQPLLKKLSFFFNKNSNPQRGIFNAAILEILKGCMINIEKKDDTQKKSDKDVFMSQTCRGFYEGFQ